MSLSAADMVSILKTGGQNLQTHCIKFAAWKISHASKLKWTTLISNKNGQHWSLNHFSQMQINCNHHLIKGLVFTQELFLVKKNSPRKILKKCKCSFNLFRALYVQHFLHFKMMFIHNIVCRFSCFRVNVT